MIAIPARFCASASALRHSAEAASRRLVDAVWAAGGEPVVLHPHSAAGAAEDAEVAARLRTADGVLLPGGGELAASSSGQAQHEDLDDHDVEHDAFHVTAARVALESGTPMLAICRGAQVVNIARGGTVVRDRDTDGEPAHHRRRRHDVQVDERSLLGQVVGATVRASCYHHQRLATLGHGLAVTARAQDGVAEAIELVGGRGWFVGVQWHPEDTWSEDPMQLAVFRALVAAARGDRAFRTVG